MIASIQEETGTLPEDLPRGVSPETAAENVDVQNIIAPRLTMLMEIANSFLLTIMDSIDTVPYGIRWICKQIRSLTKVRPGFSLPSSLLTRPTAQVSGGDRLCNLLAHRRLLLPPFHQPCDRHAPGLHAH